MSIIGISEWRPSNPQTASAVAASAIVEFAETARTELHLLGMNLHNLSVEVAQAKPCLALILDEYATRIDSILAEAKHLDRALALARGRSA